MAEFGRGQTLRVLVISAQEEARDEVEAAFSGWSGGHQLFWVAQPDLGPARAQDLLPHVVLVDDELAGSQLVPIIRELARRVPSTAILALVEPEAIGQARQAVLAGARGFVTKPLQTEELVTTLQETLAPRRLAHLDEEVTEPEAGHIVVFCAPKGGTGRTTLAINTAISLRAMSSQPVVLVDADYAAPALDVALNLRADRDVADLLPQLSRLDEDLVSGVLATHATGLQVLLAPPPADLSRPISLPQVQHILVLLKRMFPWVIVDLGLPLNETAFGSLDTADGIVMTVLPEMVGLRNTRLMLDQLRDRGYAEEKVQLVLNRATMKGGVGRSDIEERLGVQVSHRIPDDQPLATHSINRGIPLVLSHRRSAVARAVQKLARQLMEDLAPAPEPSGNLLERWMPRTRAVDG